MIYDGPSHDPSSVTRPRGLLIDFDYARPLKPVAANAGAGVPEISLREHSAADRTVTSFNLFEDCRAH